MKSLCKLITICMVCLLSIVLLCGCNPQTPPAVSSGRSSENLPQGTKKFVGSWDTAGYFLDMEICKSVEQITKDSPAIVIAHYTQEAALFTEQFYGTELYASDYQLTVDEVLKGECPPQIRFFQTGRPGNDDQETKIKKNTSYLLFLNIKDAKVDGDTIYDLTGVEQGIVEIREGGKLYSYVDYGIMAQYDDKDLETLVNEIKAVP